MGMKLLLMLLIASCSSYFPPIRGQYTLTTLKHFMISNMYVNPANLKKQDGMLLINYDVIVKNVDNKSHDIDLQKSMIKISNRSFPMHCHRYKEQDIQFTLNAEAQTRIICLAQIQKADFKISDYQSILEIPLDRDLAKFEYLLRAEDFK